MAEEAMFELRVIGPVKGLGQAVAAPQQTNPHMEQRRQDQETGRRLACEYAEEALLVNVHVMRTSPDENIKLRAAKNIMDRAWGQTKALTEEEKKGADAGSILDVLAAVSARQGQIERTPPDAPALEHDPASPDDDLEQLLNDLDTDDAVLIDG